jgi:CRP-like cAMP-binding protein
MIAIQAEHRLRSREAVGRVAAKAGQFHPAPGPLERLFDLAAGPTASASIQRNRTLVREGDRADTAFLVQSGILRRSKVLPDGRRQVVSFHEQGALVGLLEGEAHAFSLEAVTPTRLRPANRLRLQMLFQQPEWHVHLLSWAASELAEARSRAVMLGRQNAKERVCSFLLHRARPGRVAELRMSRKDMADYLGLTVETVSRLLTQMETGNLIRRISAQRIEVLDPGGLVHLDGEVRSTR